MSLNWIIRTTLNCERKMIACYLINTVFLVLIFNLMMETVSIGYPICVSLIVLTVYLAFRANSLHRFLSTLASSKSSPGYKANPENVIEQKVFATIDEMHTEFNHKLSNLNEKLKGRNLLFSQFIHNMKTSAAVIELACSKASVDVLSDIALENEKLKANLEQSLNVLRFDEFSNDYIPERVDLLALIHAVINDKRRDFIYAGVYPKVSGEPTFIYTDRKWCAYMIAQIISNAIKYSQAGKTIYFELEPDEKHSYLHIRDEGIGIEPEDVPRVFELFFTGNNGRKEQNATGIGLAMVRHVAKRLGHDVSLTSTVGVGTCVSITFLSKM